MLDWIDMQQNARLHVQLDLLLRANTNEASRK